MGYVYYHLRGAAEPDRVARERGIRNSRITAEFRLNPSNSDVDSLIFLHRRPILERWLGELPGDLLVLDVGGRIQPYRALIESKTRTYFGLDLQLEGMVDVVATAERIPVRSDSLDLVLCTDTLQYVPDPSAALREMHRVLKPGGQLILSTRGQYPEHHDELWRFLPDGLRLLARPFRTIEIEPEGHTGSGIMTTVNVLLHRNLEETRLGRVAARTSTPLLNRLGLWLDRMAPQDSRFTCGFSLRAFK